MNTTKKTEPALKPTDPTYPISPSRGGVSYVCLNKAGKQALKDLMVWATKKTSKKQTYTSTIIYLNNLLNNNESDN